MVAKLYWSWEGPLYFAIENFRTWMIGSQKSSSVSLLDILISDSTRLMVNIEDDCKLDFAEPGNPSGFLAVSKPIWDIINFFLPPEVPRSFVCVWLSYLLASAVSRACSIMDFWRDCRWDRNRNLRQSSGFQYWLIWLGAHSAEGTSGMRKKPHANTLNMKTMPAIGQKSAFLILLQLAQTYRALQRIYEILRFIYKQWESLYHRRFQPYVPQRRWFFACKIKPTTPRSRSPSGKTSRMPPKPSCISVQQKDEPNQNKKKYNGRDHDSAFDDMCRFAINVRGKMKRIVGAHCWIPKFAPSACNWSHGRLFFKLYWSEWW